MSFINKLFNKPRWSIFVNNNGIDIYKINCNQPIVFLLAIAKYVKTTPTKNRLNYTLIFNKVQKRLLVDHSFFNEDYSDVSDEIVGEILYIDPEWDYVGEKMKTPIVTNLITGKQIPYSSTGGYEEIEKRQRMSYEQQVKYLTKKYNNAGKRKEIITFFDELENLYK